MTLQYVRSADAPLVGADTWDSKIHEGYPVVLEAGGGVHEADPANDSSFDGIVVHKRNGAWITEDDEKYTTYDDLYVYDANDDEEGPQLPIQPLGIEDVYMPKSIKDESATEPVFDEHDVVGFIDLGNGPRLVQEGYSTGGTTYGRSSAGNFVVAGRVARGNGFIDDGYDTRVQVRVARDLASDY